jgi:hypothetical protein
MREEVGGATTGEELSPDGFGDARANFFDVADVGLLSGSQWGMDW